MLRISVLKGSQSARLKLEGKLAHEWVAEAQKAWAALIDMAGQNKVVVDLADVSFVDDHGKELLTLIHRAGSELVGTGPMVTALIEEIQREHSNAARQVHAAGSALSAGKPALVRCGGPDAPRTRGESTGAGG